MRGLKDCHQETNKLANKAGVSMSYEEYVNSIYDRFSKITKENIGFTIDKDSFVEWVSSLKR